MCEQIVYSVLKNKNLKKENWEKINEGLLCWEALIITVSSDVWELFVKDSFSSLQVYL